MTKDQLKRRIQDLARQVYSANTITPAEAIEYDELTKFPELKKVIVDLLTLEYDNFLSSIDWVAPRPSTFRINLKKFILHKSLFQISFFKFTLFRENF